MFSMDYLADKTRCIVGIFVGTIAMLMCIAVINGDPEDKAANQIAERSRDGFSRAQLATWRYEILNRHR